MTAPIRSDGGVFMRSVGGVRGMGGRVYFDDTPHEVHLKLSDFDNWSSVEPSFFGAKHNDTSIPDLHVYEIGTSTLWKVVDVQAATVDFSLTVGMYDCLSMPTTPCPTTSMLYGALCEGWLCTKNADDIILSYSYSGLVTNLWRTIGSGEPYDDGPHSISSGAILTDILDGIAYVVDDLIYVRIEDTVYPLKIILDVDVPSVPAWAKNKFSYCVLNYEKVPFQEPVIWGRKYHYYITEDYADWTYVRTLWNAVFGRYELTHSSGLFSCLQQLNDETEIYPREVTIS